MVHRTLPPLVAILTCVALACGGSIDGASSHGADGGDTSADGGSPSSDDGSAVSDALVPDGGILFGDGAPTDASTSRICQPTVSAQCSQGGTWCPPTFATAGVECIQSSASFSTTPCNGFDVVVADHGDGGKDVLYYDRATGTLVGVVEWSGFVPGGPKLVCSVGGTFPDPATCAMAPCPTPVQDAAACPSGIPMAGTHCPTEGLVCGVTQGCGPECECVHGTWACGPAPPCPPGH